MLKNLQAEAKQLRRDIIDIAYKANGPSHPGPALSCADIVTVLYYDIMHIRPQEPRWENRDRLILSKGHACPAVYAALARKGYFPVEDLLRVRHVDSYLQGHPDMNKTPGIDMTTGSLGNGLSLGVGMALYAKHFHKDFRTFVILGDGELQEGVVWEGAMSAGALGLDNLIAVVDYNHWQSCGRVEDILCMEPMTAKWEAFGWYVLEANGHDLRELATAFRAAMAHEGQPAVIIAHTVKGKGISYMENNNIWHQSKLTDAQYAQAMQELEEEKICL